MNKAIFIDRDGVINKKVDKMSHIEQFEFLDSESFINAIKMINDNGYLAIIVTNQPDISKGILTWDTLNNIHKIIHNALKKHDAHIDDIMVCPHHPEKGFKGEISELKIDCECRKPKPGLIFNAAKIHDIDLSKSWMIGDSPSDIAAGQSAGVKTIFLTSGGGSGTEHEKRLVRVKADAEKSDLLEAIKYIFKGK
jgi:D-glycero-D-manno-heptose 1,7-bisphosphate phosphatase